MRRHDLDWTSLIAGIVVTALGAAYLTGAWTDLRLDGRWILPLALIGLGLAGLAGGITAARRTPAAAAPVAPVAVPGGPATAEPAPDPSGVVPMADAMPPALDDLRDRRAD